MKHPINTQKWLSVFDKCASKPAQPPLLPKIAIANPPFSDLNTGYDQHFHNYECAYVHKKVEEGDRIDFVRTNKMRQKTGGCALFIESCLKELNEGEALCFLVENGILSMPGDEYVRDWIKSISTVIASCQFPVTIWKQECSMTLTTSMLILQKVVLEEDSKVMFAMMEHCGFTTRRSKIDKNDLPETEQALLRFLQDPDAEEFDIPKPSKFRL